MGFRDWYIRNSEAITWFVTGWVAMSCLENLLRGNYVWAAIDAAIVFVNIKLS